MPAPEVINGWRVVATPAALDAAAWPAGTVALRLAADEVLLLGTSEISIDDPHALVEPETGFCGVRMGRDDLEAWLGANAEWPVPRAGSYFVQGSAAGLPVKVWVEGPDALLVTRTSLAADLEQRL